MYLIYEFFDLIIQSSFDSPARAESKQRLYVSSLNFFRGNIAIFAIPERAWDSKKNVFYDKYWKLFGMLGSAIAK